MEYKGQGGMKSMVPTRYIGRQSMSQVEQELYDLGKRACGRYFQVLGVSVVPFDECCVEMKWAWMSAAEVVAQACRSGWDQDGDVNDANDASVDYKALYEREKEKNGELEKELEGREFEISLAVGERNALAEKVELM